MFALRLIILSLIQGCLAIPVEEITNDLLATACGLGVVLQQHVEFDDRTLTCKVHELVPGVSLLQDSATTTINTGYNDSQVKFQLYTQEDKENFYVLEYNNSTSLKNSKFVGSKKTYFILHGYFQDGEYYWVKDIARNLLTIQDANVIAVTSPTETEYTHAFCNLYKIGIHVANYIKWLYDKTQLLPSNIHLIGHSLGAHISGLTGYNWNKFALGKISRITGLDPGSLFDKTRDPTRRLHKDHAEFVDIIHTSAVSGSDAFGHADFYPNGGEAQPGCLISPDESKEYAVTAWCATCSHMRAASYFNESILIKAPQPAFKAWPCSSYEAYKNGTCKECNPACVEMGFYLKKPNIIGQKFYLTTKATEPYAKGDVQ